MSEEKKINNPSASTSEKQLGDYSKSLPEKPKKEKQSFEKTVRDSCLKNRISPTTIEMLLNLPDKQKVFKALTRLACFTLPDFGMKEQVKILKDLIKISESL